MSEPKIWKYKEVKQEFGGPDPGTPNPGEMNVFYEKGIPRGAEYLCPCGCEQVIYTPLDPPSETKRKNRWQYMLGPNGGPTLMDSVRWLTGCKAHFNITDGLVKMASDSGQ